MGKVGTCTCTVSVLSSDVLSTSAEDFETSDEVFDAIGAILQEVDEQQSEEDIR